MTATATENLLVTKKGAVRNNFVFKAKQIKRAKVGKSGLTALPLVLLAKGGSTRNV